MIDSDLEWTVRIELRRDWQDSYRLRFLVQDSHGTVSNDRRIELSALTHGALLQRLFRAAGEDVMRYIQNDAARTADPVQAITAMLNERRDKDGEECARGRKPDGSR